jgi:hypothetical protein
MDAVDFRLQISDSRFQISDSRSVFLESEIWNLKSDICADIPGSAAAVRKPVRKARSCGGSRQATASGAPAD